jgi:selenocysteine-specific elongation factor
VTRLVVGVIGHVDHGKTALVRALTGTETDRLPEEKQRGISIALGFAHLAAGDAEIDLIDMPGHERFVRTMISGATGIDAVLLVVAANEGVNAQTVEHADIAALLGIRRAVVAVTKADLVTPDEAERVERAAAELLGARGIVSSSAVITSILSGQGMTELAAALAALASSTKPRTADGLAWLPIDRAFSMSGHGPVVTGTLRRAPVRAGDVLELWPLHREVRVRAVQVHGAKADTAMPGQRTALNLRDVAVSELGRGMALAAPHSLEASEWLTIAIRAVADAPPLKNGRRLSALFGTEETEVRLRLLDRDVLEAGEEGFAQLRFAEPAAVPAGEHVILRLQSPIRSVAGGRILEPVACRRKRNDPAILKRLEMLRDLSPQEIVAAEVAQMGVAGIPVRQLSQLAGLAEGRIAALLEPLPVAITRSGQVMLQAELEQRKRKLTLRSDPGRARADAALAAQIAETLRQTGLTPPLPKLVENDALSRHAVDKLLREGAIIRAVDRAKGKEMLFHRDAIDEAKNRLTPLLLEGPGLLVTEIASSLGISRKFVMPLLDHLDTIRFTRRIGDRRLAGLTLLTECSTRPANEIQDQVNGRDEATQEP